MHRLLTLAAMCVLACAGVSAQTPQATDLPGKPFFVKKTWMVGGEGNWDYLTVDPVALQLFIAHGPTVQVVDVSAGKVAGEVSGLHEAHEIALDDNGQYGYVSDGPANEVVVFDRRTLEIVTSVPTGKNPRALVFDPATRLVFVVCPATSEEAKTPRRTASGTGAGNGTGLRNYGSGSQDPFVKSTVSIIDANTQKRLADLILPGKLGFAQTDGKGTVFVNITDRNQIAYFHSQGLEERLRRPPAATRAEGSKAEIAVDPALTIDWSDTATEIQPISKSLHNFRLRTDCDTPKGLAVDSVNQRLFITCDNMTMQVLNATSGDWVTSLPIGAGNDAIGYDAGNGLIYAANGGGVGSLTVIRQHLNDTYNVIQEVPTRARARTLAINPVSGEVYLVTNVTGLDLTHNGGIGGLKTAPVEGSFQVLVIGN